MEILGIDFGCTFIKYGVVRFNDGLAVTRFGSLALDDAVELEPLTRKVESILDEFPQIEIAGMGLPTIVRPESLFDTDIPFDALWKNIHDRQAAMGKLIFAMNDADAAGMAEILRPEAQPLRTGVTVVLTLGTGIGSAVFNDGVLLPNTELGVVQIHGQTAEHYTAASVKTHENLSLTAWAARLQEYLEVLEFILSPDTIILGGGISVDFEKFAQELHTRARLLPAFFRNQAGVIGAAMFAREKAAV